MKICTVIGARPQFIKASVVSRALLQRGIVEKIVHTGQHYDSNMSDVFFDELGIAKPEHNLGIGGGSHGQNTGQMIEGIEATLINDRPDLLLVYGDTDSTLSGAIAASKLHIPVAHVEAGLRSFNRLMPEEINRVLTDHVSSFLYAPTSLAMSHLANEGISDERAQCVGDVMYDAALFFGEKAECNSSILSQMGLENSGYVLATVHRAENTDDPVKMAHIINGFAEFGEKIVLPLHPRTRARLKSFGLEWSHNVSVIEPVGYLDMVMLEKNSRLIVTDSGGVQKEAYFYRVPCLTLRDQTEWTELVDAGWNRLLDVNSSIASELKKEFNPSKDKGSLYGKGEASEIIVDHVLSQF